MKKKETRELVHDLAEALLDAVGELEDLRDVVDHKYAKEMAVYDRAITWLQEQNKG